MEIRKLQGKERFDAYLVFNYCFHGRVSDVEKEREKIERETLEDWGAFTEDGTLAARIINNHYDFLLDGKPVKTGGIGAVATLPEYREDGCIRKIFESLLKEAYQNGEVLSALFPFNHAFYRKQGYDVVTYKNTYELDPALLAVYKLDGKVTAYKPGESVKDYMQIYNRFIQDYNLAVPRDEQQMLEHMKVEQYFRDRKFSYLFEKDGEKIAYLTFTDVYHNPAAILHTEECAWTCNEGFYAILAFLGRFTADYGTIELTLPYGIDLMRIIRTPKAYEIKRIPGFDFMVRVINVKKALEAIKKPAECDVWIQVTDELIRENNGIWHVTEDTVEKEDDRAFDMTVNIRTFSQMVTGCISPDEAFLKEDIEVLSKTEMIRTLFPEKKIFHGEHF